MSETLLVNGASVAALGSSSVVAFAVVGGDVDFRLECDQIHTLKFYVADATFSAITSAALLPDATEQGVDPTTGTDGNLYHIDAGNKAYAACVLTNDSVSASATVTIGAE